MDSCFWACPYELVAFDFSKPMALPYEEADRWAGDLLHVDGFDEDGRLTWTYERDVRLPDGTPYDELSDVETAELLNADGHYLPGVPGTQRYRARWIEGTPFDSTVIEPLDPSM